MVVLPGGPGPVTSGSGWVNGGKIIRYSKCLLYEVQRNCNNSRIAIVEQAARFESGQISSSGWFSTQYAQL